jgi:hypothetical protein
MTDDEVANGITIEQFRKGLTKADDGLWILNDQPLTWITTERPIINDTSSELTDYDMEDEESSNPDVPAPDKVVMSPLRRLRQSIDSDDTQGKRPRGPGVDEDEDERAPKRAKISALPPDYKSLMSLVTDGPITSPSSPQPNLPSEASGVNIADERLPDTTTEANPQLPTITNGPQVRFL